MMRTYLSLTALAVLLFELVVIGLALMVPTFQAAIRSRGFYLTTILITLGLLSLVLLVIFLAGRGQKPKAAAKVGQVDAAQAVIVPEAKDAMAFDATAGNPAKPSTARPSLATRLKAVGGLASKAWSGLISVIGEKTVYATIVSVGFSIGIPPGIMLLIEKQILKADATPTTPKSEQTAGAAKSDPRLAQFETEIGRQSHEIKTVSGQASDLARRVTEIEKSRPTAFDLRNIKIELVDSRGAPPQAAPRTEVYRETVEALAKAIAAVHWSKYSEAVEQYDLVLGANPSNAYVLQLKAHALLRADKPMFAEACARQSLKVDANYLRAYLTLATAMCAQGNLGDAQKVFRKADQTDDKIWSQLRESDGLVKRYCGARGWSRFLQAAKSVAPYEAGADVVKSDGDKCERSARAIKEDLARAQ